MKIKDNIRELQEYLKQPDLSRIRTIKKNKTTERWYKAMRTTPEFVTNNSDIHIMEANKGKVTVAINKGEYEEKIKKFDNKGVEKKIFEVVEEKFIEKRLNAKIKRIIEENTKALRDRQSNIEELKELIKMTNNISYTKRGERTSLDNIKTRINKLKENISNTAPLKKMTEKTTEKSGTVKIHKADRPIRPIVNTKISVGGPIA